MVRRRQPPSQTWRTFLANHIDQIMAADFFVVPTATYRLLFVLVILAHERGRIVRVSVTDHPTAAWTLQQLRDAFPWFIGSVRRECLDHVIVLNAAGLRRVLTGYVEYTPDRVRIWPSRRTRPRHVRSHGRLPGPLWLFRRSAASTIATNVEPRSAPACTDRRALRCATTSLSADSVGSLSHRDS